MSNKTDNLSEESYIDELLRRTKKIKRSKKEQEEAEEHWWGERF